MMDDLELSTECLPVIDVSMVERKRVLSSTLIPFLIRNMVWVILIIVTLFFCLIEKRMFSQQIMMNVLEHSSILGILVIGLTFCLITGHFDLSVTREWAMSLIYFSPVVPQSGMFLLHAFFAMALIMYMPFSKILHFGGIFFTQALVKRR